MANSIIDKIKSTRSSIASKRRTVLNTVRKRIGVGGLGLESVLDITLQDISAKGILPTIKSRANIVRTRVRQKVGMKTDLVSRVKTIVTGKSFAERQLPRSKSVPEPGEATEKQESTVPQELVMPQSDELRPLSTYPVKIKRRTV